MILVNGVDSALVHASDRGLGYGDGVFRTFAVLNGMPQHWPQQYAKLAADCAVIRLSCPEEPLLKEELGHICREEPDCAVKVIITRGVGQRGYPYAQDARPTRIVLSAALPKYPHTYASSGVKVRRCGLRLAHQPALAGVKHLNRLENVLARAEWYDSDIAEGILCDIDDNVIGGTMTNLFVVKKASLATPSLHLCGIAGVTRQRLVAAAARHGLDCTIRDLSWSEVLSADEIFLSNSLVGIWPVREIEGTILAPGALTRAAQRWLKQEDDAQVV